MYLLIDEDYYRYKPNEYFLVKAFQDKTVNVVGLYVINLYQSTGMHVANVVMFTIVRTSMMDVYTCYTSNRHNINDYVLAVRHFSNKLLINFEIWILCQ